METKQIISWLLDKAARAQDHSYARMLNQAAKRLKELDQAQSVTQDVTQSAVNVSDTNVVKWIPVAERLPAQGQEVIVYTGNILSPVVMAYKFWDKDFDTWLHVTHWMPLPEPPKEVDNG